MDDGAVATTMVGHDPGKPLIQDVIGKRIGDDRRDYSPNAKENFCQVAESGRHGDQGPLFKGRTSLQSGALRRESLDRLGPVLK